MPQKQTLFQTQTVAVDTERILKSVPFIVEESEFSDVIQAFNAAEPQSSSTQSTRPPSNDNMEIIRQKCRRGRSLPRKQLYSEEDDNDDIEVKKILSSSCVAPKSKMQINLSNTHAFPTGDFNLEERLVQALRALEKEHRTRQEAEIELANVRQQLLTDSLIANQNRDGNEDNSTISPHEDSELATRLNLLQLKLNEEVDHRQSLEAVYATVKKQLLEKEEELFKSQSTCQDLEMAVQRVTLQLNSSQLEHERLKDQMNESMCALQNQIETENVPKDANHEMPRRSSVFSADSSVLSRNEHVPDGEPKSLTAAGVQTNILNSHEGKKIEIQKNITMLRAQLNNEKCQLERQTTVICEELQVILSLNQELGSKVAKVTISNPHNREKTKQLEIEIERLHETQQNLEKIANEKLRSYEQEREKQQTELAALNNMKLEWDQLKIENQVVREDLKKYIEKYAVAEQKVMETEERLEVERRSLESLNVSLSEANVNCREKHANVQLLEFREKAFSSWLSKTYNTLSVFEESTRAVHAHLCEIFKKPDAINNSHRTEASSKVLSPADLKQIFEILGILNSAQDATDEHLLELRSSGLLADCDDNSAIFQSRKLNLLQSVKLPLDPHPSLSVEQFLIDRLLELTKMEEEARWLAKEKKAEVDRLQIQLEEITPKLACRTSLKKVRHPVENKYGEEDADAESNIETRQSETVAENRPEQPMRSTINKAPPPIGSFENIFSRLGGHADIHNNGRGNLESLLQSSQLTTDADRPGGRISWATSVPNKFIEQCQPNPNRSDRTENQNNFAALQEAADLITSYQLTIQSLKAENAHLFQELSANKVAYIKPCATHQSSQNDSEVRQKLQARVTELEFERGRMLAEKHMLEENAKTEHRLADKLLHQMGTMSVHQPPASLQVHRSRIAYGSHSLRQHRRESSVTRTARRRADSASSITSNSNSDGCDTQRFSKPLRKKVNYPRKTRAHKYTGRSSERGCSKNYKTISDSEDPSDAEETMVVPISIKPRIRTRYDTASASIPSTNRQLATTIDRPPMHDRMWIASKESFPKSLLANAHTSTSSMLLEKAKLSLQAVEKDLSSHGPPPSVSSPDYLQYLKRKYLI